MSADMINVKKSVSGLPGYIKAMFCMGAAGIACTIALGFMRQYTPVDVLMYFLSFAGIFCEFLLFCKKKRLAAVLVSLVPLAVEAVTEFFFSSGTDLLGGGNYIGMPEFAFRNEVDVIDAVVYIGIPAVATLFFAVWKTGNKDTIPLIGVLMVIFVLCIEAYVAYYSVRLMVYFAGEMTAHIIFSVILVIIARLSRRLMYLNGFWKAGNVKFVKEKPY